MRTANGMDLHSPAFEDMENHAFEIIDRFIDENISKVKLLVMRTEKEGITDEEVEEVADELAKFIFSNVNNFDPDHIDRFIKFYINERTLPNYINKYLDYLDEQRIRGASVKPVQVVEELRLIAAAIDRSNNPSIELVVQDLHRILASIR